MRGGMWGDGASIGGLAERVPVGGQTLCISVEAALCVYVRYVQLRVAQKV